MAKNPLHPDRTCLVVVLAAGEGTRMKSALPKVLHRIAGRSLLGHVLASTRAIGADAVAVVVGPGREDVADEAQSHEPKPEIFVQADRLGTAHAVLAAGPAIDRDYDDVIVVFGDTPLLRVETLTLMRNALAAGAAVVAAGFEAADPTGYGRFILDADGLAAIREDRDASDAERAIRLCNGGIMAVAGHRALDLLKAVGQANAKQEFYLTDLVSLARQRGLVASPVIVSEEEVLGVNDRAQLAAAEAAMQRRLRAAAMANGATLVAPETVFFAYDTELGRDVVVEPNVVFGPRTKVHDGAVIHAFSHLEGATVGAGANVGPFARLRPGAHLGADVKVGNFVEVKGADIGAGTKISHLSYIGDARIGADVNIGAGAITCNYDGFDKYRTEIGAGAFIGSNSSLVAPVTIGAGAFVGSGSVVTDNVPEDALALGRGRQVNKLDWAEAFRTRRQRHIDKKPE